MRKWNFNKVALFLCSFIKITRPHGCSQVNLLYIFRTPFYKNTIEELLLEHITETKSNGGLLDNR